MTTDFKTKRAVFAALKLIACVFVGAIMLYPFWWMLTGTFKTAKEIIQIPPTFFPHEFTFENKKYVFESADVVGKMYINSFVVAISVPLLQTLVCLPAAYAFAKLRFPGKNVIFMFFMGALMLPGQLTMITNYSTIIKLNLINKLTGVILLGIFSAFAIFMMRQFIAGLPREVDDAAKMDGCGFWGTFLRIGLPLSMPIVSVNLILCFNAAWGDFFTPMLILRKLEKMTLSLGMTVIQGAYGTQSRAVMVAMLTMSIIPVIAVFFIFRDKLIAGIATSGLKL